MIAFRLAYMHRNKVRALLALGFVNAQADIIAEQKEAYGVRMSQAMNLHADQMEELSTQYASALEGSATVLQKQGNLDGLLPVSAEIIRFKRTGSVPTKSAAGAPPSVIKLQEIYNSTKAKADTTKGQATGELTHQ